MEFAKDSRNVAPSLYLEDLLPTQAASAAAPSDIEEE